MHLVSLPKSGYSIVVVVILLATQFNVGECSAESTTKATKPKLPNYTPQEQTALRKLRASVPDIIARDAYYSRDSFLRRWLLARNMDASAAEKMLRAAFKWRLENNIDSILSENILDFNRTIDFRGHDKTGRPLVLLTPLTTDIRGLILKGRKSSVIRVFDQFLERGFQTIKNVTHLSRNGEEIFQFGAILDFADFNKRQHHCFQCLEVYLSWFKHFEQYYPGIMKYIIIINGHREGAPLGELIRPVLSKQTNEALVSFGTDKKIWSKFLLSIIDSDQLPYRFGGTRKPGN